MSDAAPTLLDIEYQPFPTLWRFHHSDAFVRMVMGPFGSGKSVGMCMEIIRRAMQQRPFNGVRYSRWVVIRNTYPDLISTTIQTWREWIPEEVCPLTFGSPIKGHIRDCDLGDGTKMDLQVWFTALDKPKDVRKLKSLEFTGAWLNEASEIPWLIVDDLLGRPGRYPRKARGGASWCGIIGDTNPPSDDSWYFDRAETIRPKGWAFFRQPGGLLEKRTGPKKYVYRPNPKAENIPNLPGGFQYYYRQVHGATRPRIQVRVLGEYGTLQTGKAVYDGHFQDHMHVSETPLAVYKGIPLHLGWDFGTTPAVVFCQLSPRGQLRILREAWCPSGGIIQFAKDTVLPMLANEFPGMTIGYSVADPAGEQRSQRDGLTCIDALCGLGIPTEAAPTNKFLLRIEAVIGFLRRNVDGEPGLIIDPRCSMIRKGFNGEYHYRRIQVAGTERYAVEPEKNNYSHPHDALQYPCLRLDPSYMAKYGAKVAPPSRNTWAGAV